MTLGLFVSLLSSCATYGSPPAAGNEVIQFAQDMRRGEYGAAFQRLCTELRNRTTLDQFSESAGGSISEMFTTHGWSIEAEDRPEIDSLDPEVTSAWRDVRVQRRRGSTDDPMDFAYELWRLDLIREDGQWKLCGVSRR